MKHIIKDVSKIVYNPENRSFEFYSNENQLALSLGEIVVKKLLETYSNLGKSEDSNSEYVLRYNDTKTVAVAEQVLKDYTVQVYIYLPADEIPLSETEKLTNACGEFMEALGYELKTKNEPIFGSFLQSLWFKIKKGTRTTGTEIAEDFAKGKKALELKYIELPTAEQTEKLANSASKIVEILDKQDEGVIRLGALLVLKKQIDGKGKIIIQQLDYRLISILDQTPNLLQNLQTVYELVTGDVKGIKYLDEPETESH